MRWLLSTLFVVLVSLQYLLWVDDGGMRKTWRLEAALANTTIENITKVDRNNALEAEVRDLKTGLAAVEERARTELGMIGKAETFYLITRSANASTHP